MTLTVNFLTLSGLIADADGMPGKMVPTVLRRVRMFDSKNLIPVHREDKGRREGRVDLSGACMARVHNELIDFGMDATTLRHLREFLDRKAELGGNEGQFTAGVEQVRAGKPVALVVELWQRPDPWFKDHAFRLEGVFPPNERAERASAMADAADGVVVRARMTLDLTQLLGEFIGAFETAAAQAGG